MQGSLTSSIQTKTIINDIFNKLCSRDLGFLLFSNTFRIAFSLIEIITRNINSSEMR